MKRVLIAMALILSSTVAFSAEKEKEKKDHKHEHHVHKAPHGGTLVGIGDHFANVEFVLDAATGKLTAYVLDGCCENAVRIKQKELELDFELLDGVDTELELKLKAVGNVLTGESVGDSSQFEVQSDKLKGVKRFDAEIKKIEIKGQTAKEVDFGFPKGTGHAH